MTFKPAITPTNTLATHAYLFLFCEGKVALTAENSIPQLSDSSAIDAEAIYLGELDQTPCYAQRAHCPDDLKPGWNLEEIRPLFAQLASPIYALIGYASQILTWRENHPFCSKCGSKCEASSTERAMKCPSCGFISYPRISPCIIVAVTRGRELLMARSPHFPAGLYSIVAGFVEPGETLEQCVAREVLEETGITVKNIRYFSNQPWAFPHSIMIGFTAEHQDGEIQIDQAEIEDAFWRTPENMPILPDQATIARWLIDDYLTLHEQKASNSEVAPTSSHSSSSSS